MSNVPTELKYTASHEWVRAEENGVFCVGITDHAQSLLGDMVFVDLPEVGAHIDTGAECAVAESVKAASDIYSPLAGEIVAINGSLEEAPEQVNAAPYDEGWLFRIRADDPAEFAALLSAEGYLAALDE